MKDVEFISNKRQGLRLKVSRIRGLEKRDFVIALRFMLVVNSSKGVMEGVLGADWSLERLIFFVLEA